MRTFLIIIGILGLIALVAYFIFPSSKLKKETEKIAAPSFQAQEQKKTDITASFSIETRGTLRVFTDTKYHNLSADVYIQVDNPSVIHVKKSGLTWSDFFKTLPMKLSKDCLTTGTGQNFCTNQKEELKFSINGQSDPSALDKIINDGDRLLVSFGPSS